MLLWNFNEISAFLEIDKKQQKNNNLIIIGAKTEMWNWWKSY